MRAGANWQMLTSADACIPSRKKKPTCRASPSIDAGAAHQTYRMLDDFIQDAFAKRL